MHVDVINTLLVGYVELYNNFVYVFCLSLFVSYIILDGCIVTLLTICFGKVWNQVICEGKSFRKRNIFKWLNLLKLINSYLLLMNSLLSKHLLSNSSNCVIEALLRSKKISTEPYCYLLTISSIRIAASFRITC